MKIPKKIKAFGKVYTVNIVDFMAVNRDSTNKGTFNYEKLLIELDKSQIQVIQEETFIHELVHLICRNMEMDPPEEDVCRLGVGIYHVLKDNKLLAE